MASEILKRDNDRITVLGAVTDDSNQFITQLRVDPVTGRLKVSATITGIATHFQTDQYTSTNNQTAFTSSQTVVATIGFFVNGVYQNPGTDYTATATTLTLTSGIPASSTGTNVAWVYIF